MVIDTRSYVISLVAVFLSLGVGILIGTTLLDDDVVLREQERLIARLEKDFTSLRLENRQYREQVRALAFWNDLNDRFHGAVLPLIVKGRLQGVRVAAVITTPGQDHSAAIQALRDAGAEVMSVTTIPGSLAVPAGKIGSVRMGLSLAGDGRDLPRQVAVRLAEALVQPDVAAAALLLAELGIVRTSGQYGVSLDAVVLFGGAGGGDARQVHWVDGPLIQRFQELGLVTVGAERSDAPVSFMPAYQKMDIPTVDNDDMAAGQVALVWALAGEHGHFGIKATARSLVPSLGALATAGGE